MSAGWCGGPGLPVDASAVARHPLALAGLAAWAILLVTTPRDRTALGVLVVAAAARWAAWGPRLHYHLDRGYRLMVGATGVMSPDTAYGEGHQALLVWPHVVTGGHADALPMGHSVLSALAAPHLVAALRPVFGERAAVGGGLALALAPLPVLMASAETRYVAVLALCAGAAHGLTARGRRADLLLALCGGLLAHLRPFEGLWTAAFAVAAAWQGRRAAAVALTGFVALRLGIWAAWPPGVGGAAGEGLTALAARPLVGPGARALVLDPLRTPAGLVVLAALGLMTSGPRTRWPALALGAAALAASLLYVPQPYLADRLRMQLPAQVWLCALAGVGLARLPGNAWLPAAVMCLATWWPARRALPELPWQAEHAVVRRVADVVPPGAVIAWDDHQDDGERGRWMRACTGHVWTPLDEAPAGSWRFVGLADHAVGAPPVPDALRVDVDTGDDPLWGCADCRRRVVAVGLVRPGAGATSP